MKKILLILIGALGLTYICSISTENNIQVTAATTPTNIPIYATYSPNVNELFFTKDINEHNKVQSWGWQNRGIAWYLSTKGKPVYRMVNYKTWEHLYTTSETEKNYVIQRGWFAEENIIGYSQGSIPVYRFYHYGIDRHMFTADENQKQQFIRSGYTLEGIAFYATAKGTPPPPEQKIFLLNAPNYDQYRLGAPSGCEGAALLQAEQAKGRLKGWSLRSFLNTMPRGKTPYQGFVGSPFEEKYWVYSAMYPAPLTSWAQRYGGASNASGASFNNLIEEVKRGNPSVIWVTVHLKPVRWGWWPFGQAVNNNHAVTLDGWDSTTNSVHISDSISGKYWVSKSTIEHIYNARKYAVVIR